MSNLQELQNDVADRLGISANQQAFNRIGRSLNIHYREVVSSLGLQYTSRTTITATTTIGNALLVFTAEKLFTVYNANGGAPVVILNEISLDEMRNRAPGADPAQVYAIYTSQASTVTILLESTPTTAYPLTADAQVVLANLTALDIPVLPTDYHDLLMYGALRDEFRRMGKIDEAELAGNDFTRRLSELRYYLSKSAYRTIYQGKTAGWGWPTAWWGS